MEKNPDKVLKMILDIHNIYTKYLNQANYTNNHCKKIRTIDLRLEQKHQISNNERLEIITLFEVQVAKSN